MINKSMLIRMTLGFLQLQNQLYTQWPLYYAKFISVQWWSKLDVPFKTGEGQIINPSNLSYLICVYIKLCLLLLMPLHFS